MIVESGPSNWGGQLILDGFSGEREPALGDARSESVTRQSSERTRGKSQVYHDSRPSNTVVLLDAVVDR